MECIYIMHFYEYLEIIVFLNIETQMLLLGLEKIFNVPTAIAKQSEILRVNFRVSASSSKETKFRIFSAESV